MKHYLDVDDLTTDELTDVLDRAATIKSLGGENLLGGQTLGMIFEKPSTRTRVSFETGMTQLGGHAVFLGPDDIHLGHGEPVKDTSRALSRYVDFLMARVFEHADVEELAEYADVPVINGLTDDAHPCQTLADLLTIREHFGDFDEVRVAWVGDGNNVCQSFALGAAMTGLDLTVATPEGTASTRASSTAPNRSATPPKRPTTLRPPSPTPTSSTPTSGSAWVKKTSAARSSKRSTGSRSPPTCWATGR